MSFVTCINVPGYLPMSDDVPAVFATAAEAWQYLADERQRDDLAYVPDDPADPDGPASLDATTLELEAAARDGKGEGTIYGPTPNGGDEDFSTHDLGLVYSVTAIDRHDADGQPYFGFYADDFAFVWDGTDSYIHVSEGGMGEPITDLAEAPAIATLDAFRISCNDYLRSL